MSGFLVNKSLLDPTVTQYTGGTASFTLPQSGSTNATEVFVGGVPQVAGVDFNVSGTALTLTTSAPAGSNMVCARQYFADGITGTPASNSVATAAVQDNAINLAKMAGGTDGNIISFDASGDPVYIATGNDSQVLTSAGAGQPPAFEDAAGGLWKEIATGTNSAALTHEWLDGTGGVVWDTTYDDYILDIRDIDPGGTSSPTWFLHEDGGSYLTASNYWWRSYSHYSSSDEFAGADGAANGVLTGGGNQWHSTSAAHYFISIYFRNTMDAIDTHLVGWMNRPYDTGPFPTQIEATYNGTNLVDGFKITAGHTWTCTWRLTGRTA